MYSYRYINKFIQLGVINYTLIIEDLEDPTRQTLRVEKSFNLSVDQLDDDVLAKAAQVEILNLVNGVYAVPEVTPDDGTQPDDDSEDGD
jgi:hypothetical protein